MKTGFGEYLERTGFNPSPSPFVQYIIATGGQVIRYGDWLVREFYSSDIFEVTQEGTGSFNDVEYFGEAGGASGGSNSNYYGAGGGGGGKVSGTWPSAVGSYSFVIGAGGAAPSGNQRGNNGNDTTLLGQTAIGGGAGAGLANLNGADGGNGGGASQLGTAGTGSQGFDGGLGSLLSGGAGGGGGLSQDGGSGDGLGAGGVGGDGISNNLSNITRYYGGGGGGGGDHGGYGGLGGGGNGIIGVTPPEDGEANTGGGGGGGLAGGFGAGGSGYAAVKYFKPAPTWPSSVPLPISQWHLDGNANDSIGTNNGTATNVTWQQAKINDGASFNGSNSKIDLSAPLISDLSGALSFTLSFFVQVNSVGSAQMIFDESSNPANGNATTVYVLSTGQLRFWTGSTANLVDSATILSPNILYFVCCVYNTASLTSIIYINGVSDNSASSSIIGTNPQNPAFGYSNLFGLPLGGEIDEFCLFNYALTPSQVADLNTYYNS